MTKKEQQKVAAAVTAFYTAATVARAEEIMKEDKAKGGPATMMLAYIVAVAILVPIYFGTVAYVTWQLWEWYFVPMGLYSLHPMQALAACFILWAATGRVNLKKEDDLSLEEFAKRLLHFFARPWIFLFVGWVLKGLL